MSKYEQRGDYHYRAFQNPDDPYHKHVTDVVKRVREAIGLSSTLLDVGAGEGLVIDQLQKEGIYCLGCEIDQHAVDIASRKGNPVIKGMASAFDGWSFDAVIALDVLEHVGDPHHLVERMFAMASSLVVIAMPSVEDPHAVHDLGIDEFEIPGQWHCTHRETRHYRDLAIFEPKANLLDKITVPGKEDHPLAKTNMDRVIMDNVVSEDVETPSQARAESQDGPL